MHRHMQSINNNLKCWIWFTISLSYWAYIYNSYKPQCVYLRVSMGQEKPAYRENEVGYSGRWILKFGGEKLRGEEYDKNTL